jgi:hypothetical protein
MPDTQAESTQVAVTNEQAQPESQTPQQETREALYQKLYGQGNQPPAAEITPPNSTLPAQEPDYKALYAQQAQQLQAILEKLNAPAPTAAVAPPAPTEDWFALLQAGKRTEAEQVLKDYVAQGAQQKIIQETLVQAMELNRMEREIEDFNNSVRASNSDMLDVEDLISLKAEKEFSLLQPTIKNNKDYIAAYKTAVNKSVDAMRNTMRRTRAAAKNEALTTKREVLASTTMAPNDITQRQETSAPHGETENQMQSPTDYLAARQAAYRKSTSYGGAH